jgi:RHS repeat-associated protein
VFEDGSFVPVARITEKGSESIVTDYLGTPAQMYDETGQKTWSAELDIYGRVRNFAGRSLNDCPFRYQGQYQDEETGLYYNRFRYYDLGMGSYLSQDPIRLDGGMQLYGYVNNTNSWLDPEGLSGWLLGNNLEKAGQGVLNRSTAWQAHHVIPQATWNQNKDFFKDVGFKGKHSANNGIFLPNTKKLADKLGFPYYHSGSHGDYSDAVQSRIAKISEQYNIHGDKARARADLEKMQKRLKNQLSQNQKGLKSAKRLH